MTKPWGRTDIPACFGGPPADGPLGEIWFQRTDGTFDDPLLVKYLFTSERLSIQVHPDDASARRSGQARGKDEAWVVLDAAPDAEIGIGLTRALSGGELRAAALDGTIVDSIDWRPAKAGDCYYSPAGTIHSIGAGLTLVEVQQNSDVTYRLYDFGRPRELHLDESVDAARTGARVPKSRARPLGPGREAIVEGPKLVIERWSAGSEGRLDASGSRPLWLIPLHAPVVVGGIGLEPPGVWIADEPVAPEVGAGGELLIAYPGNEIRTVG